MLSQIPWEEPFQIFTEYHVAYQKMQLTEAGVYLITTSATIHGPLRENRTPRNQIFMVSVDREWPVTLPQGAGLEWTGIMKEYKPMLELNNC